jgi:hypothetical protein
MQYQTLVRILDAIRAEAPPENRRYAPDPNDLDKVNQARARAFSVLRPPTPSTLLNLPHKLIPLNACGHGSFVIASATTALIIQYCHAVNKYLVLILEYKAARCTALAHGFAGCFRGIATIAT